MISIAQGLDKRGKRAIFDGKFADAVDCFFHAYLNEPTNSEHLVNLIYALNQNGDFITSLEYCYALIGMDACENRDMLYYLTAEAFGGAGSITGCAQMLERSLKTNPEGAASKEATAFLKDVREKYDVEEYDSESDEVAMGTANTITEAPFINEESYYCMLEVGNAMREENYEFAKRKLEEQFINGNFTVVLLNSALLIGYDTQDNAYIERCASRFKFVEDYTVAEIRSLAYTLEDMKRDDIAYDIFRELYSKESGEREIAFAFAVACERIGDEKHANEIMREVALSAGGIGPATHFLNGERNRSYVYTYEGKTRERLVEIIKDGKLYESNSLHAELFDFVRYSENEAMPLFGVLADCDNILTEIELRRLAITTGVSIFVRARAAKTLLINGKKNIFLNTGPDIVRYTEEIQSIIEKFSERISTDEGID